MYFQVRLHVIVNHFSFSINFYAPRVTGLTALRVPWRRALAYVFLIDLLFFIIIYVCSFCLNKWWMMDVWMDGWMDDDDNDDNCGIANEAEF